MDYIKNTVADKKAIIALSGGVDSFTAAALCVKAGVDFKAVFVDTGFMRLNEPEKVREVCEKVGIPLVVVDAQEKFFNALKGVVDPEQKRKIIGKMFIDVFAEEAKGASVLVQGTIAPDWIESGGGRRKTIKSHHNVGGLPEKLGFELCEPLREYYKHEVRMIAKALGLPEEVSERQPFPGPGLAIRVLGEVTPEKVDVLKKCCAIAEEEIERAAKEKKCERPWQYFAVLLNDKAVGVAGDERIYKHIVVVRAVGSLDGMTAHFSQLPYDVLQKISTRITTEVKEVGRVLYDITSKPPGTIEFE